MTELATTAPSVLDNLAGEARYYSEAAANNLFQLARVLTEARQLVRHGEWRAWLQENAGCSERTAQQMMQAYARYGDNPNVVRLDRSKVFKLLSLPEGTEADFLETHDVGGMSAREVDAAVKQAVADAKMLAAAENKRATANLWTEVECQRRRAEKAEQDLAQLRADPPLPEDVAQRLTAADQQANELRAELDRVNQAAQDALLETNMLRRTNSTLMNNIRVLGDDLVQAEEERDDLRVQLEEARKAAPGANEDMDVVARRKAITEHLGRLDEAEEQLRSRYNEELRRIGQERDDLMAEWRQLL